MTHLPVAAAAAPRRRPFDPEAQGKVRRVCDAGPIAEAEIKAALAAARCGIVRHRDSKGVEREFIYVASPGDGGYSLALILHMVAKRTGTTIMELRGLRRFKKIARARQLFYALAKELTGQSYPVIGRALGNRDHSTVLHGVRKVAAERHLFEPEYSELLAAFPRETQAP